MLKCVTVNAARLSVFVVILQQNQLDSLVDRRWLEICRFWIKGGLRSTSVHVVLD